MDSNHVDNSFSFSEIQGESRPDNEDLHSSCEQAEIEAAEKVINAMRYYQQYCMIKLKRRADAIRFLIFYVNLDKSS